MRAPTDTERPLACGTVTHRLATYQELKTMSPHRHWKTDVRLMPRWTRRTIGREDENRTTERHVRYGDGAAMLPP
jgi:hypothetical protein